MEIMTQLRKRKGVSPVIATVILVAVTITVAVAVAYWMSGIAGQYTNFEQVKIQSSYASRLEESPTSTKFMGWIIELKLQNSGSSTSTLETVFVNDMPITEYGISSDTGNEKIRWLDSTSAPTNDDWTDWDGLTTDVISGVSLDSGDEDTIYILIYGSKVAAPIPPPDGDGLFSAGTTINVKIHSASGMDYIKLVQLK